MTDTALLAPPGLSLTQNITSEETWEEIRDWMGLGFSDDSCSLRAKTDGSPNEGSSAGTIPWEKSSHSQNRPVAQFGSCRYDYVEDSIVSSSSASPVPPIPPILRRLLLNSAALEAAGCGGEKFDQCIINVYDRSNIGIPWHLDDGAFGPVILVYTFGEARPLQMRMVSKMDRGGDGSEKEGNPERIHVAYPEHRSCYVLSGMARDSWEHSIPQGYGWRISVTFRTLL